MELPALAAPEPLQIRKVQTHTPASSPSRARRTSNTFSEGKKRFFTHGSPQDRKGRKPRPDKHCSSKCSPASDRAKLQKRSSAHSSKQSSPCKAKEQIGLQDISEQQRRATSKASSLLSRVMTSIGTIKERAATRGTFASGKANRDETDCATKADLLKQMTPPRIPITLPSPRERGLVYPRCKLRRTAVSLNEPSQTRIFRAANRRLSIPRCRPRERNQTSRDVPMTYAFLECTTDSLEQDSDGSISASVSVNVSAGIVDMDKGFQDANGTRHPLDALVLIDSTPNEMPMLHQGMRKIAADICSAFVPYHDRLGLCCLSPGQDSKLTWMLPLASCYSRIDIARCLDKIEQIDHDAAAPTDLPLAVDEVHRTIPHYCRQDALVEVFVVSSARDIKLISENANPRVRIHTISPWRTCRSETSDWTAGCHLFAPFGQFNGSPYKFPRRLDKWIRFLRLGLDSGHLKTLAIKLTPEDGCCIGNTSGNVTLRSLIPGETWTINLRVKYTQRDEALQRLGIETASQEHDQGIKRGNREFPVISTRFARTLPLFKVSLEYDHSRLPNFAFITTEMTCHLEMVSSNGHSRSDGFSFAMSGASSGSASDRVF